MHVCSNSAQLWIWPPSSKASVEYLHPASDYKLICFFLAWSMGREVNICLQKAMQSYCTLQSTFGYRVA